MSERKIYLFRCEKSNKEYITSLTHEEHKLIRGTKLKDLDEAVNNLPKEIKSFKRSIDKKYNKPIPSKLTHYSVDKDGDGDIDQFNKKPKRK